MNTQKILFLGAAPFQIPAISYAKQTGRYVITCDNKSTNPGHNISDKAYNVSTLDFERILEISKVEQIDGIMTFGSDVSSYTAAYVSSKLGLPGNPPDAIKTLTNKGLFRERLSQSGLQTIMSRTFSSALLNQAITYIEKFGRPVVIKPVDNAGSKGVSFCDSPQEAEGRILATLENSISKQFIIEERIYKSGYQVCGDGFFENSKIVFVQYGNGHFYEDTALLAPFGETFPCCLPLELQHRITAEIEKALNSCGFKRGPFNLDVLIDSKGAPFIIEIGPRSGGNFIPNAIRYQTGVDMIAGSVEAALSWDYSLDITPTKSDQFYCCYMLHVLKEKVFHGYEISANFKGCLVESNMYVKEGTLCLPFNRANHAIGNLIFSFHDYDVMMETMNNMGEFVKLL